MQYYEFLAELQRRGGPAERDQADATAKSVLAALGQRLKGNEPRDLADQLPQELQEPLLQHTGEVEIGDDVDDFLRRVADRQGPGADPELALQYSRAVLETIGTFVSAGEIDDLRAQLPAGYAPLFE